VRNWRKYFGYYLNLGLASVQALFICINLIQGYHLSILINVFFFIFFLWRSIVELNHIRRLMQMENVDRLVRRLTAALERNMRLDPPERVNWKRDGF